MTKKPIGEYFADSAQVRRTIPEIPRLTLIPLSKEFPASKSTTKMILERLDTIKIGLDRFLNKQEELVFVQKLTNDKRAWDFDELDGGTLGRPYSSPYIMPTIEHKPWQRKYRLMAPGMREQGTEISMDKTMGGVYEPRQSLYQSNWSRVKKKFANALRLVHNRHLLNKVNIRHASISPKLNKLVELSAGALEPLELASMPMGYTNTPAKFQIEHGVYFEARDSG
jgi:hypothetical protein